MCHGDNQAVQKVQTDSMFNKNIFFNKYGYSLYSSDSA